MVTGECPVDLHVMDRVMDRLAGQGEPQAQEVDPQQHREWVRGTAVGPGMRVRGAEGIPWHHRQHLLQELMLGRPLGPALEPRRQARSAHPFTNPHLPPPPLHYAGSPWKTTNKAIW